MMSAENGIQFDSSAFALCRHPRRRLSGVGPILGFSLSGDSLYTIGTKVFDLKARGKNIVFCRISFRHAFEHNPAKRRRESDKSDIFAPKT